MAVMAIGAWAQSASDYGIVMEQPDGELKTYDRAGYAYYYSGETTRFTSSSPCRNSRSTHGLREP